MRFYELVILYRLKTFGPARENVFMNVSRIGGGGGVRGGCLWGMGVGWWGGVGGR